MEQETRINGYCSVYCEDIDFERKQVAELKAELKAHKENEGEECPLCQLEAENGAFKNHIRKSLFGMTADQENEWLDELVKEHLDALKDGE